MTCAWRTTNQKPTSDLFSKFITNFLSNDVFTFSWCKSSTLQILCLSTSRNGNRDNCTLTYTTIKMQLIIIMNCFTLIFIFIYMQQTDYKQMKTDWIRCLNYFWTLCSCCDRKSTGNVKRRGNCSLAPKIQNLENSIEKFLFTMKSFSITIQTHL